MVRVIFQGAKFLLTALLEFYIAIAIDLYKIYDYIEIEVSYIV